MDVTPPDPYENELAVWRRSLAADAAFAADVASLPDRILHGDVPVSADSLEDRLALLMERRSH